MLLAGTVLLHRHERVHDVVAVELDDFAVHDHLVQDHVRLLDVEHDLHEMGGGSMGCVV